MSRTKTFTITIETGNAAFDDGNEGNEVARILREAADRAEMGSTATPLRDYNGNVVGRMTVQMGEPR